MKIALVLCLSWDGKYSTYPLAALAAGLGARGHEAGIFDLNQVFYRMSRSAHLALGAEEERPQGSDPTTQWTDASFVRGKMAEHARYLGSFVDDVLAAGHRVVGFSVYGTTELMSLEMARLFKRRDPSVVIVFGGSQYQKFQRCLDAIGSDCVDAVVFGEGDVSFPALIERLERTGRLEAGPGILLRNDASTWKESRERVADLDEIPFADYKAHRLAPVWAKAINTSRGCVRKCDFCSEWRSMKFRQKSADRIHQELRRQLADHPGVKRIFFADSLVNGVPKEYELLCDRIIREPLGISWDSYAIVRPEMTRALLEKTRQTGCEGLFYGIESGSERLRLKIGKNTPDALIASVLKETVAAGIKTRVGCIAGHPNENEDDFERTLAFLAANAGSITDLCLKVFVADELDGEEENFGLAPLTDTWFWRTKDGANTFPVRIERVRRLARAAAALGISANFEISENGAIEGRCNEMLELYWRNQSRLKA